jgi:RNA polymerase sigma-70 factor (ECF subfamily)
MPTTVETEILWRELHDELLAFVRRHVNDREEAEDIVQDVFVRVHANLLQLRDSNSVHGWVYRIARNAITDHYRSGARARRILTESGAKDGLEVPGPDGSSETEPDPTADLARCMRPLLQRLPASYAEAIRLTELNGLTQEQAARRAGLSVSGMKSRVQRGRRQLKELLLACCSVSLDSRRHIIDYGVQDQSEGCGESCGCGAPDVRKQE